MSSGEDDRFSRGETAALGSGLTLATKGGADLRRGKRGVAAAFVRNKANELDLTDAQNRFRLLREAHKTHGVAVNPLNPDMKRVQFSKRKLDESDILNLGFEPVSIAIPEKGQQRVTSFRHPASNYHLHDHGGDWIMHEDAHAALPMRRRLKKLTEGGKPILTPEGNLVNVRRHASNFDDIAGGASHLFTEGLTGGINAVRNYVTDSPTMSQNVKANTPQTMQALIDLIPDKAKNSLNTDLLSARALKGRGIQGLGLGAGVATLALLNKRRRAKRRDRIEKQFQKTSAFHIHLQRKRKKLRFSK